MAKGVAITCSLAAVLFSMISGCGDTAGMIESPRDQTFYKSYQNPASASFAADQKMDELKIIQTNDDYPIRIALFDNGTFYYQVDRLGDGNGEWYFQDGAVHLVASRPVFNMEFVLSGSSADPDGVILKFVDRHGLNSKLVNFRDPAVIEREEGFVPALRPFEGNQKGL